MSFLRRLFGRRSAPREQSAAPLAPAAALAEPDAAAGLLELDQEFAGFARLGLTAAVGGDGSARRKAGRFDAAVSTRVGRWYEGQPNVENFLLTSGEDGDRLVCAVVQGNEKGSTTLLAGLLALSELDWFARGPGRTDDLAADVGAAMRNASARIGRATQASGPGRPFRFSSGFLVEPRGLRGLGTSITVAAVSGSRLVVGHVGEGAAYLWRAGLLRRLTPNHMLSGHPDYSAMLRENPDLGAMHGSVVLRVLGAPAGGEVDLGAHPIEAGDAVVLGSSLSMGIDLEAALREARGGSAEELRAAIAERTPLAERPDLATTVGVIVVEGGPARGAYADPQR